MPRAFKSFTVLPRLPARLSALHKLAHDLWLAWNPEAIGLFRRLDPDLWENVGHSPVKLLGQVEQSRLEQLLEDDGFLAQLDRTEEEYDAYVAAPGWFQEH
ncbi:MAG: DUF3417 domain-containing protein, partial [Gemmataceae bacterium]|nr:DUF3417 domain-containing protein [Gemmataceae bacterium]